MFFFSHVLYYAQAWLPSAAVEGHVDGSPVVARRRPPLAPLGAKASSSSAFVGRGVERVLDDDQELGGSLPKMCVFFWFCNGFYGFKELEGWEVPSGRGSVLLL